jgi:hypothetical protein
MAFACRASTGYVEVTPCGEREIRLMAQEFPAHEDALSAMAQAQLGDDIAVRCRGHLLGIGGVAADWSGNGRCWILLTREARSYPIALVRTMGRFLAWAIALRAYRRVEAHLNAEDEETVHLVLLLGFTFEAVCARYFPWGDAWLYARITPEDVCPHSS